MKKLFALFVVFAMSSTSILSVFASTTDEELAALLNDLEGGSGAAEQQLPSEDPVEQPAAQQHQAAEDILNAMDEGSWAYAGEEKIEVKDVTSSGANLVVTQVTYNGTPVTKYKVYYSDKTLATVEDFDKIDDVVVNVASTEGTNVTLKFENLTPNKTYYVVVAPVNPDDATQEPLSFISDEVMFTTQQEVTAPAPAEKIFDNVSYTYKDSKVTLTWTPSAAAQKAQIELRHQSESTYTKIGTPNFNDGTFSFTVSKSGTYFLKLTALDGSNSAVGQEHIQTIKIDEVLQPAPDAVVQAAPQVGPATDLMIALMIVSVLVYGGVRLRKVMH